MTVLRELVRRTVACLALLTTGCICASQAWAAPPPIENFTRRPAIDDVAISPSGKRLAVLVFGPSGHRRLGVMDLDPLGEPRIVGEFSDADVTSVTWVNDDRLVFEAFRRGAEISAGGAGTFSVNHDGTDQRQLIAWRYRTDTISSSTIASRVLPYGWFLHSVPPGGGDDVIVFRRVLDAIGDLKEIQVARLNVRTRELKNLSLGLPDNTTWVTFDSAGRPRMARAYAAGRSKYFWREKVDGAWEEVLDIDPLKETFAPWFVDAKGDVLVQSGTSGTIALHRFDPSKRKLDPEPLVRVKGFDLNSRPEVDGESQGLMGIHLLVDGPMSYWFDEGLARLQKGIDTALPAGRSNRLYCGNCASSRFFVIRSTSDRQPGEYYLFDRKTSALQLIGAQRPWIDEKTQGRRSFHYYEARDGLKVPIYVTHPASAPADKPLPTVVLVHGGPYVRGGDITWEAEAQLLASRGYLVLQPEFRGSTGFGTQHFRAGWKQWGLAMQDDLADAVKWAAKSGLADEARVCIMGGSYGGYAALMSPIVHPGVYKCAASFAGVTDPELLYTEAWSDISEAAKTYGYPVLLGDPVKDADLLAAASPLKRVAELKVPVLLGHGGVDRRVPIVHARKFADAAVKAGVKLERVEYLEEGHGFFLTKNANDYYRRVENLLESTIGSGK